MERNNLLNLLLASGIVVAIALGGISLGITLNKSKNSTKSGSDVVLSGILGLVGGYKTLNKSELKAAKQAILRLEVNASKTESLDVEVNIAAGVKEVEIFDLSKSIGDLEWIKTQVDSPNLHTNAINIKTLYTTGYRETIELNIETASALFNRKNVGSFKVQVEISYTAPVVAVSGNPAIPASWKFEYKLLVATNAHISETGVVATAMVKEVNSVFLKDALLDDDAIAAKNIDILLWKSAAEANANSSDYEVAIILDKNTGKVYAFVREIVKIVKRSVINIAKIPVRLK